MRENQLKGPFQWRRGAKCLASIPRDTWISIASKAFLLTHWLLQLEFPWVKSITSSGCAGVINDPCYGPVSSGALHPSHFVEASHTIYCLPPGCVPLQLGKCLLFRRCCGSFSSSPPLLPVLSSTPQEDASWGSHGGSRQWPGQWSSWALPASWCFIWWW